MGQIFFARNSRTIEFRPGANLMRTLLESGVPVASSCFGRGICTKCKVKVVSGAAELSPPNALEKRAHDPQSTSRNKLAADERLSCQTRLLGGDVRLDTTYW